MMYTRTRFCHFVIDENNMIDDLIAVAYQRFLHAADQNPFNLILMHEQAQ